MTSGGSVEIPAGESVELARVEGRGLLDGFLLLVQGPSALVEMGLEIWIDGVKQTDFAVIVWAPLLLFAVRKNTPTTPITLFEYDDVNKVYGFCWNSPLFFDSSLVVKYVNHGAATHTVSFTASASIEL